MKILRKLSVFCLAFLIGMFSVLLTKTEEKSEFDFANHAENSETNLREKFVSQTEKTDELETIKEVTHWDREDFWKYRIKLLETGEGYHGNEVDAKSGETWYGLFKEKNGYFIRPTKIKIRRVHDEIVDYNKKAKTGKDVLVDGKIQPVFLVKNANEVKIGKVKTLFQGLTWNEAFEKETSEMLIEDLLTTLKKGFSKQFEIGGKKYELKVIEAKNAGNEKLYALLLESGNKRQVIHTMIADANYNLGHLYWVGDLDGDEKPDFYFDLFEHYNVNNRVLYFSSFAQGEELIGTAAYFWTTGC